MINLTIPGNPVATDVLLSVILDGDPVSYQRARTSGRGGHFYTSEKLRSYTKSLIYAIKEQGGGISFAQEKDMTFGVHAKFYRSTRQRVDLDNLLKTILDAVSQSGFWVDDSRVHEIYGSIERASASPRVEFIIYRHILRGNETDSERYNLSAKCTHCGKPMSEAISKSYPKRKIQYCCRACFNASRRVKIPCAQCGKDFEIPRCYTIKKRFCSRTCSLEYNRHLRRIKGKESDKWVCTKCGGRVSRKEYKICQACSMTMRSDPTSNYWQLRHPCVEVIVAEP